MNKQDAISTKYWGQLMAVRSETMEPFSIDAILLALRLAIAEAADSAIPESALVAAQNEAAMLRQQLADARREIDELSADLRGARVDLGITRYGASELTCERDALRKQLAQLDADNADLTRKLATANAVRTAPATIHANGNGAAPTQTAPANLELADYWGSLDAGRRTFRSLDKHVRLDLVQTALATFAEPPTQAAFNFAKPEWMPTATSICQSFGCTWQDLPTLTPEKMQP